jgi:heme-degrading monooxygenase HmoA
VIVCIRTVVVPDDVSVRFRRWIADGRAAREAHGLLAEWVLDPTDDDGESVVITVWPSHEVFDAWIATPHRAALTASEVHQAVDYRPIVRYDLTGGYTNLSALVAHLQPTEEQP